MALVGKAPALSAQSGGQQIFVWQGRVDREVQINMRNTQMWTRNIGTTEAGRAREQVVSRLPRGDGQLTVQVVNGRGSVDVIQQPSQDNAYTAVIRVRDDASGSDQYRITGYWQGYSNGDVYGNNRNNDNGRARGRDGDDRRDVYRDRDDRNNRSGNGQIASSREVLHWSGNVDNEVEVRIQNGRVDTRTVVGLEPTNIRADRGNLNLPRTGAVMGVVQNQGRGSVTVIQQPSSLNGYTTVIRVRDPSRGIGFYDFDLIWQ